MTVSIALTRRLSQSSSKKLITSKNKNHNGALQVYSIEARNGGFKGCVVGSSGMNDGNGITVTNKKHLFRRCDDPK
jgi:hypothetical protein